jgi:hypothetical protein
LRSIDVDGSRRTGRPKGSLGKPLAERLAAKSVQMETGCVEWRGAGVPQGYGHISVNRRMAYTHRVAYELARGPIPPGHEIDHLCFNRRCVNPQHLEPVTHTENRRRSRGRGHVNLPNRCGYGHVFDAKNTGRGSRGSRVCRACRARLEANRRDRNRAQRAALRGVEVYRAARLSQPARP